MLRKVLKRVKGTKLYPLLRKVYIPQSIKRKLFRFQGEFEVKTKDGKSFKLFNPPFHLETEIYWQGIDAFDWEIETRRVWNLLSTHSKVIFDIGANTGIFAVMSKAYNSNAKVYAFEPQPNIFKVLSKNNQINNFDISCENVALSKESGQMPFFNYGNNAFSENSTAGSLNPNWRTKNQKSILVEVETLDSFIVRNEIDRIDLMKIDVESFELEVLQGYIENLNLHKPFVVIEIVERELGVELEEILDDENYLYFNIDETKGLKVTKKLGGTEYNNYLVCPKSRLNEFHKILGYEPT